MEKESSSNDGIVIVYTGNGKGKTTASLGVALRAIGHGLRVCMVQFIKGEWHYGELNSIKKLEPDFELIVAGKGFIGIIDDDHAFEEHVRAAKTALDIVEQKISLDTFDIIILDEINYALHLGVLQLADVMKILQNRPKHLSLILTGNHACEEIITLADLVTEMKEIKHPYKKGIKAKRGIDF
ncbi:MAG: cob(I)yrinic acid a,c-diamide adenosyltransferase [Nitrososphaeraceae archaeon]|jgi:cob(I)alamin adenosyltransferase|nr:cob(I)yrinic acid a,c-diamide adenosyltransferase [Nitrososphaeraceae archaeon]MDW0138359.1 cob(I)yrinic acid a,c-diamide adenosyltransferase [Nitrososphaeraceae archaeon]MDW0142653.1 cob(I)yrinic acid a,c-diamide adenosyltransferase [Nitrososphaeraceae archaeon]MDW0144376.1 cob(I)yrinic acid a,c-diamide adenosyltransferase [Nitrososphaeraceae archaeon]MDW0145143.1 cob(I)yrinic acid a,c-diamide adenosyltransferase [Nitrososphaeraceae archaeon]